VSSSADADRAREQLARAAYLRLGWIGAGANSVAAVISLLYGIYFVPAPGSFSSSAVVRNVAVFVPYLAFTIVAGLIFVQGALFAPIGRWLRSGAAPTAAERTVVLRLPLRWSARVLVLWGGALVLFTLLNLDGGAVAVVAVAVTVVVGAVVTTSLQYLLTEQTMRPIVAIALAGRAPPPAKAIPGVTARLTMAWTLGAGAPMVGIVGVAVLDATGDTISRDRLAAACALLAGIGIAAGVLAVRLASRSVATPLLALRDGFAAVESGRFDRRVTVNDGSEVGRLQAGFNDMVAGLGERAQLREAFGTYVDADLIDRVLDEGVDLAGEDVDLTVMFLDVRDFTAFAESTAPHAVVARLNDLYEVVVPIVTSHGGHAAKFIGDGLLVVFGAPVRQADHAEHAVRCAAATLSDLTGRFGDALRIGIGINSGPVVAGTIGGGGRLDFTVIGDTVNTAARVEAATRRTGDDLLITEATWEQLDARADWTPRGAIELKGKSERVPLYAPASP
jgi:adenylate cyclase